MPETPDFEKIAQSIIDLWGEPIDSTVIEEEAIAEQLRLIWNARGAADLDTIHALGGELHGAEYVALRKLDR